MNSRYMALMALLGYVESAASPGKAFGANNFPLYPAPPSITTYNAAQSRGTAALGGYECIRSNLYYGFPQGISTNVVTTATTLNAFWGTKVA